LEQELKLELRGFLLHLVRVAAASTLPYFRQPIAVENKLHDGFDPVTVADRSTEDALRSEIAEHYPEHGIIGEEGTSVNPDARYQWIIDPIDGTKAFLCGLPTWSTLIGVCDRSVPLFGIMSQPVVDEYFVGGFGAAQRVNREGAILMQTSGIMRLSDASLFATSPDMFSPTNELGLFESLSDRVRLTRFGVDSYAYCLLAAGFIDIVAEAALGFYDVAALVPIIQEAGGVITDWSGAPVRGAGTVLAAANEELHAVALAVLRA
jgi:histidinol phosphatase-like enzyme (inositol monophosphatase family)